MKKNILLFTLCIIVVTLSNAQEDSISIDLLRAPSSPASTLIGISPSVIEKPSDVAAFAISIQNATKNLSQIPGSYAVDFAPAWLFAGSKIKLEDYLSNKNLGNNIWQSLVISSAITNNDNDEDTIPNSTKAAFGLKFSLLRGKVDKKSIEYLELSGLLLTDVTRALNSLIIKLKMEDERYLKIDEDIKALLETSPPEGSEALKSLKEKLEKRLDTLKIQAEKLLKPSTLDSLKKLARSIKFTRYGFKTDISLGMLYDFPCQNFDKGNLIKAGAWLTAGWDWEEGGYSLLGIVRYLNNPDKIFSDDEGTFKAKSVNTFDAGVRLIKAIWDQKFLISTEGLYRSILNTSDIDPSWRFTINLEYEVVRNSKLTFSFGRDFDGTISKSGNVIAALNFVKGLGTTKKLN